MNSKVWGIVLRSSVAVYGDNLKWLAAIETEMRRREDINLNKTNILDILYLLNINDEPFSVLLLILKTQKNAPDEKIFGIIKNYVRGKYKFKPKTPKLEKNTTKTGRRTPPFIRDGTYIVCYPDFGKYKDFAEITKDDVVASENLYFGKYGAKVEVKFNGE